MSVSTLRTLSVRLAVNTAAFRKDVDKIDRRMRKLSRNMRRDSQLINGSLASIGAGFVAAFGGREITRAADEMQNLRNTLGAAFEGTSQVAQGMLDIRRIARQSRADIGSVGTLYQRIRVSTEALGASQQEVAALTQVVSDTFLLSGTSASEAANSARQFAQGLASGALRGDEYRSVSENNVVLTKMLADGFGVTTGQLRELAAEGAITAEQMIRILVPALEGTRAKVEEMELTLGQSAALMRNEFALAIDRVNQRFGFAKQGAALMVTLANNMHNVIAAGGVLATLIGVRLVKATVMWAAAMAIGAVTSLMKMGKLAVLVTAQMKTLFLFLVSGNPLVRLGVVLGTVVTALATFLETLNWGTRLVEWWSGTVVPALSSAFEGLVRWTTKIWERIKDLLAFAGIDVNTDPIDEIGEKAAAAGDAGVSTLQRLKDKATEVINWFGNNPILDPTAIGRIVGDGFEAMGGGERFAAMLAGMGTTVDTFLSEYFPRVKEFMDTLSGKIDADAEAAGAAGEKDKEAVNWPETWAERWALAIDSVKVAWSGLIKDFSTGITTLQARYDSWGEILQGFAKKSAAVTAVMKGIYVHRALMAQKAAIIDAWATPGPLPAKIAAVALVTAQTAMILKDIMSGGAPSIGSEKTNQAHDGLDFVPQTGTFLLERGERVVDSRLNADLTRFLNDEGGVGPDGEPAARAAGDVNVNVSGVSDPDIVIEALSQRRGELESLVRQIASERTSPNPFS